MDPWILYALGSGTLFGLANFLLKPIAREGLNKHKIFLYSIMLRIGLSGIWVLFHGLYLEFGFMMGVLIIMRQILALEKSFFTIESLKYIESTLFFPIHRILHVILSLFVGILVFGEYLDLTGYIAIVLGVLMILLLSSKENKEVQINYKMGIFYLLLTNATVLFTSAINKYISSSGFDIQSYFFISSIIGLIYVLIFKKQIYEENTLVEKKFEIGYGLIKGLISYFGFIFILMAFKTGPLALVQMIHSSSIFIPIILSVIFYHEKITLSKFISLILFVIILLLLTFF